MDLAHKKARNLTKNQSFLEGAEQRVSECPVEFKL